MFGARGGGAPLGAPLVHHRSQAQGKIIKIEKIYNPTIFDKFSGELRRTLKKYPNGSVWDLTRLLFHGSNNTKPSQIYASDYGLDMRFANAGMFGTGIYFANNSHYSRSYEHKATNVLGSDGQQHATASQMFFCLVATGESVSLSPTKLQVPPLKSEHPNELRFSNTEDYRARLGRLEPSHSDNLAAAERFDSVSNKSNSHYIIYDFNKQYPAYLVTYI